MTTFLGPIVIDSTDARIAANTSTIVISSGLTTGPDVAAGTAVADFDGDFAGDVILSGDNTAFGAAGNAIEIINGVELTAANDAALGGAGSRLILNGGEMHITSSACLPSNPKRSRLTLAGTLLLMARLARAWMWTRALPSP